jgi:hypothetical protein
MCIFRPDLRKPLPDQMLLLICHAFAPSSESITSLHPLGLLIAQGKAQSIYAETPAMPQL